MFKEITNNEFKKIFQTEQDCYEYLANVKWANGYHCFKCGNETFYKGRKQWYRKCTKCDYDESATANTIFHKMKIPILKAFEIIYELNHTKKEISTIEISKKYKINQSSAWLLKKKIKESLNLIFIQSNEMNKKLNIDT